MLAAHAGLRRFTAGLGLAPARRTPHIHVKVKLGRRTVLTTQVYVEGDPGNVRDGLWRSLRDEADRAALSLPFRPVADGLLATFDIVVAT